MQVFADLVHGLDKTSGRTEDFLPEPACGDYSDFASVRSAWIRHDDAYAAYLSTLTQADLESPRTVDADFYTLGEFVQHVLNHSTYHRGQVTVPLRQLGDAVPSTDYRDFLTESRAGIKPDRTDPAASEFP